MTAPTVTIVIPVRDRAALLPETLGSVAAQTFTDWQCVVVDDGSKDGTIEETARWASRDSRFRLVLRKGGKPGANTCRNLGIRESRADLLVFLDSDDLLTPDCLSRRVVVMTRNLDLAFAVFDAGVFHDRPGDLGRPFDTGPAANDLDRFLALDPPWIITGPIWRRQTLERIGAWDDDLNSWQDIDLHIRTLAATPRYLRERVVDHHVRWKDSPDRISHKKGIETAMFENCEPCLTKWRDALLGAGSASPARDAALAGVAFHLAEQWALQGRVARARQVWATARDLGVAGRHLHTGTLFLAAMATPVVSTNAFRGLLRRWKIDARLMPPTPRHGRR